MNRIEQLGPPVARHGEGPLWDDERQQLLLVDIPTGDVLTWDPESAKQPARQHVAPAVGAVRLRAGGGLVAGTRTGFALVDHGGTVRELDPLWPDTDLRMNDGTCDSAGRFWCGSMSEDDERGPGHGALWCLDPITLAARVALAGVTVSNGIAFANGNGFAAGSSRAFYVDSPTRRVDVLQIEADRVVDREPWASVEIGEGVPDGICLDAEGGLWVAIHDGAAVVRYDSQGRLDAVLEMPVGRPTACTFGGADLDVLYVTTSAVDSPDDERGSAGALFAVRPGVRGLAAYRFAG